MGVPSFFVHIVRKYKIMLERISQADSLLLDCNSIIYDSLCNDEEIVIQRTIEKIEQYIKIIRPKNTIYIAFDGVAPTAKHKQQLSRRAKSRMMANHPLLQDPDKEPTMDKTLITPGTPFMAALSKQIYQHFSNQHCKYGAKQMIVSCSDEDGEGEHKIFDYARKHDESYVVYGLDADLIMLSLLNMKSKPIYVFRESPNFMNVIQNDKKFKENEMLFLDIQALSNGIKQEYLINKEEYVLMCFFMGNDFLPSIPSLDIREGGLERLMESYKSVLKEDKDFTVLVKNKVDWNRIYRILRPLIAEERQIMIDKQVKYERESSRASHRNISSLSIEEKLDNIVRVNRHVERYVCPKEDGWEKRFYSVTGNSEMANATHYRNMFEAVYKYYTEGVLEYAINSKILLRSIMLKNTEQPVQCHEQPIKTGVQKFDWAYKSRHWESVYY